MGLRGMLSSAPIKIGAYYSLCLAVAMLVCCQFDTFADHACQSKPYALLFTERIHEQLHDKNSTKIIFFGDSSLFAPLTRKSSISGCLLTALERATPEERIILASWSFLGAHMYDYYCMSFKAFVFSPDLLIIPINWSFFSTQGFFPELCALAPLRNESPLGAENPIRSMGFRG